MHREDAMIPHGLHSRHLERRSFVPRPIARAESGCSVAAGVAPELQHAPAGASALRALLAVTEWRIRGRLAAARLGAQLAVGRKQLRPHYAGALHVGLQEGKA